MRYIELADYYQELGLQKGASDSEIKKAYRKLALKFHPDRNAGNKNSEERFKKISEAYAVLSDPEKRKQYDTFGSADFHQRYSQDDIFKGADFNSIFNDIKFGGGGGGFDDIFSQMFGGGTQFGGGRSHAARGQDVEFTIQITFLESFTGCEKQVTFSISNGERRDLKVRIPAGIKNDGKLRIAGKGASSIRGGSPGDLLIIVKISPHHLFYRDGQDLLVDIPMKVSQLLLGESVEVETLEGSRRIKIPAGVSPGTKIRLKGLGFAYPQTPGKKGDMFGVIKLDVPKQLDSNQKRVLEHLQEVGL